MSVNPEPQEQQIKVMSGKGQTMSKANKPDTNEQERENQAFIDELKD